MFLYYLLNNIIILLPVLIMHLDYLLTFGVFFEFKLIFFYYYYISLEVLFKIIHLCNNSFIFYYRLCFVDNISNEYEETKLIIIEYIYYLYNIYLYF